MKYLIISILMALAVASPLHAKVRFATQGSTSANPVNQNVIDLRFDLENEGNIAVILTVRFAPTSTALGRVDGEIRLNGSSISGFAGNAAQPQAVFFGTFTAHQNDLEAIDHRITVRYNTFLNSGPVETFVTLIYDDGGVPDLGDLGAILADLEAGLEQEILDRIAADAALQANIDAIITFFEDRIATLETQVADLIANGGGGSGDLDALRTELRAYIDTQIALLAARITTIEQELSDLSIQVDGNETLIQQLQTLLQNSIDARILLEQRITALENNGGVGAPGPQGATGATGAAGQDGNSFGDDATDYLIPVGIGAGVGLGTSIIVNSVWPEDDSEDPAAEKIHSETKD